MNVREIISLMLETTSGGRDWSVFPKPRNLGIGASSRFNPGESFVVMTLACLCGLLMSNVAHAYLVGPALPLEKLAEKADFICKATVVSSKPFDDNWFDTHAGFATHATDLKIVEVYKGANLTRAEFRHYAMNKEAAFRYSPQHYEFEIGRTYLIFAAKTDNDKVLRQLWKSHTTQEDQGVLLAADDSLHPDKPIKEICWLELTGLLNSKNASDVKYAIQHLNRMSDGLRWGETTDFPREGVLKVLLPLLSHVDSGIGEEAILALGTNNPMVRQDYAPGWLATIGKGHIPGYAAWDVKTPNLGGQKYFKEIATVADLNPEPRARALAIRALGHAKQPLIRPLALRWAQDPNPQVAQAAIVLLSDYLEDADQDMLTKLANDPRDEVRIGVAMAIGYGQVTPLIPVLGTLVNDPRPLVSAAASLNLLSFSLDDSEATLKANLKHANCGPLFVNALAQRHGLAYVDELCDIIHNNRSPENWWGGFVVWGDSWNVLFKAAQAATKEELTSQKFTRVLAALEAPASGDPKAPTFYSSSEPRDLYALYLQKGLPDHAKEFRAKGQKAIRYDIEYFFKQVDQNPSLYVRRR